MPAHTGYADDLAWTPLDEQADDQCFEDADLSRTIGTVYLLCFVDQDGAKATYRHAGHYIGWASNLDGRLACHRAGRGAKLTAAVVGAGLDWVVAQTWERKTRHFERQLHNRHGSQICPRCHPA